MNYMNILFHYIQELLTDHLIPKAQGKEETEERVFYKKMMGDYYRYLAEVATEQKQGRVLQQRANQGGK